MIACACKEILMGPYSNLGPFDPQINGIPAQAILEEFLEAGKQMSQDNSKAFLWQPIIGKYPLGFISSVQHSIKMAEAVVEKNLRECMFKDDPEVDEKIGKVLGELGSNRATQSHSRHIHFAKAAQARLRVLDLSQDSALQDAVLSVHHASMITFEQAGAFKMIENHSGSSYIHSQNVILAV